jgi:hypothetical protein
METTTIPMEVTRTSIDKFLLEEEDSDSGQCMSRYDTNIKLGSSSGEDDRIYAELKPELLNNSINVLKYTGGAQVSCFYDISHISQNGDETTYGVLNLLQIVDAFNGLAHCSANGRNFDLLLECAYGFTLTHLVVRAGVRCTSPLKCGYVLI